MSAQDLQIRAKKISALDNYDKNIREYGDKTYLIVGYNDPSTNNRGNYKISLTAFLDLLSGGLNIDDTMLLSRIQSFISNGDIQLPAIQGPQGARGSQGPQGARGSQGPQGSGANIDITDIQAQLDRLQELIDNYHSSFNISYSLIHLSGASNNPSVINKNGSATLAFTPDKGYKMPSTISVTPQNGCNYTYNKSNKSVSLSDVTANITIQIVAELNNYTLSYTFNNVNYTFLTTSKETYTINDTIRIRLNAIEGYVLPETESNIIKSNCTITYNVNEELTEATLEIKPNGNGNMNINCSATQLINNTYYFGFINDKTPNIVNITWTLSEDEVIEGISNISVNSLEWPSYLVSKVNECPFTIGTTFKPTGVGRGENDIFIVPKEFYNATSYTFNDGKGHTGKIHNATSVFPLTSNAYKEFDIDNIPHIAVYWGPGLNETADLIIS